MLLFLLLLSTSCLNALKWIECPLNEDGESSARIELDNNEAAVGIRSYGWPNSMTTLSGETRYGDCNFRIRHSVRSAKLVVLFLNAHIWIQFNNQDRHIETNNRDYAQSLIVKQEHDYQRPLRLVAGDQSNYDEYWNHWNGFEAVVALLGMHCTSSHHSRSQFPFRRIKVSFETGPSHTEVVNETNPSFAASEWHLQPNELDRQCAVKTLCVAICSNGGESLKLVFSVFTLDRYSGDQLTLYDDDKPIFTFDFMHPDAPQVVFYTNASFRLEYDREGFGLNYASQFVAVVSAFQEKPAKRPDFQCQLNTQMVLKTSTSIRNNIVTDGFVTPYASQQECNWQISTLPGKELRFYPENSDFEGCCDVATFTSPNISLVMSSPHFAINRDANDSTPVIATRGAETTNIYWKSDGNYGRAGFSVRTEVLDCDCGPTNIDLSIVRSHFGPSKTGAYCRNMSCEWNLTFPAKTLLALRIDGNLRGCWSANPIGDSLIVANSSGTTLFSSNNCSNPIPQNFYSVEGELTITFRSSDLLPLTNNDDSRLRFYPYLFSTSVVKPRVLVDANDFQIANCYDLFNGYKSGRTFQLGPNMTSNRLQLFTLTEDADYSGVVIIDGATVQQLNSEFLSRPFVSKTGTITLLMVDYESISQQSQILIKVYDGSGSDQQVVILSADYEVNYTATSQRPDQIHCALLAYVGEPYNATLFYVGMRMAISSLEGTNESVKVFPGVDITKTPLYEFNQTTMSSWNNTLVYGQLFTILVPIGASYDFDPSEDFTYLSDHISVTDGVFMTPFYPFGSNQTGLTTLTQNNSHCSLDGFQFELFVESFNAQSSLDVYADSLLVYSFRSINVSSLLPSYETGPLSTITFDYTGPASEKGFFVRYSSNTATSACSTPSGSPSTATPGSEPTPHSGTGPTLHPRSEPTPYHGSESTLYPGSGQTPRPGSGSSVFLSSVVVMLTVFVQLIQC